MTRDAIIFTVGALVGLLCGLGVALAGDAQSNPWTSSGAITVTPFSGGCLLASIPDHEPVTIYWDCVDRTAAGEFPQSGTNIGIARVLKGMRDGTAVHR